MIRAGTLCIVLNTNHTEDAIGAIGITTSDSFYDYGSACMRCGQFHSGLINEFDLGGFGRAFIQTRWLKPLPPLDEPVETERETVA